MLSKIQYISHGDTVEEQKKNISNALEAGCKMIQVRFKKASREEFLEVASQARIWCTYANALLIINDSIEIAKAVDADGIHLGLTDDSIEEARKALGSSKIIGGTANTLEDVLQRIREKCDYVGLGPLRFTATKEKLSPLLGFEGYQRITKELELAGLSIPIYAIGGIVQNDVELLKRTGVYGIAVSGMISEAPDRGTLVSEIDQTLNYA
ncbi:thiamine phosphate synthase [Fluviicola sp.]|uniref:thiamine phosphate synthase n=1 Tax=Fluviicola sp. TaxID=1917219 RepID=UPI0031DB19B9